MSLESRLKGLEYDIDSVNPVQLLFALPYFAWKNQKTETHRNTKCLPIFNGRKKMFFFQITIYWTISG